MTVPSTPPEEKTHRCQLAVTLKKRSENVELLTSEVAFGGAFVRTTAPPPLNSLVRLVFTLPPDNSTLDLSAHVTKIVSPTDQIDHYPGFVARFVALNGPVKHRWQSLVQSVRSAVSPQTISFARPSYIMRVQRDEPTSHLRLCPSSLEDLTSLLGEQIPSGALFVPTEVPVVLGSKVSVQIVHPITEETLELPGSVARSGSVRPGALVRLAPLDEHARAMIMEFEESVIVDVEYDVSLFEEAVLSDRAAP